MGLGTGWGWGGHLMGFRPDHAVREPEDLPERRLCRD